MTNDNFQVIVDVVAKEHDSYFEFLMDRDLAYDKEENEKKERILREFLLEARAKGFQTDNTFYPLDEKVRRLTK